MPPDRLDKLFTIRIPGPSEGSTIPVVDDAAIEEVCERADVLTVSAIAQFYKGPHPIISPQPLKLLLQVASLYAEAYCYQRDPTYAKTYLDVTKSPQWKQAECIVGQIQTNARVLFDNAGEPFVPGGRIGGLPGGIGGTGDCGCPVPELFGKCYFGDL